MQTSVGMLNLFAAPNGDLYASFLDYREDLAYRMANGKEPSKDQEPPTHLRVARSTDGGRTFGQSTSRNPPAAAAGPRWRKVSMDRCTPLPAASRRS